MARPSKNPILTKVRNSQPEALAFAKRWQEAPDIDTMAPSYDLAPGPEAAKLLSQTAAFLRNKLKITLKSMRGRAAVVLDAAAIQAEVDRINQEVADKKAKAAAPAIAADARKNGNGGEHKAPAGGGEQHKGKAAVAAAVAAGAKK